MPKISEIKLGTKRQEHKTEEEPYTFVAKCIECSTYYEVENDIYPGWFLKVGFICVGCIGRFVLGDQNESD